uniref:Uncharacterized protein n=1 Tax=Physcomitrium patens TaxID=3218 RepID=A0A2K1J0P8_PHYPA|nr:hypothetical protein PHYPA_023001 [Physcomitrium patens]
MEEEGGGVKRGSHPNPESQSNLVLRSLVCLINCWLVGWPGSDKVSGYPSSSALFRCVPTICSAQSDQEATTLNVAQRSPPSPPHPPVSCDGPPLGQCPCRDCIDYATSGCDISSAYYKPILLMWRTGAVAG